MAREIENIETERLILRRLQQADTAAIQSIGTDDVFGMIPEIETPFDASAWVTHKLNSENPTICHVVLTRAEGIVVGFVQIAADLDEQGGVYLGVGYWLGRKVWGNGYAAEALNAALRSLLCRVGEGKQLVPVHAQVIPQNSASRRVLEKCGFVRSAPPNGLESASGMDWYHWPFSAARSERV